MNRDILILSCISSLIFFVQSIPQKTRQRKPEVIAQFNFLPELEKERSTRDATYNVLQLFDEEKDDDNGVITTPSIAQRDDQNLVELYLKENSMVDCSSAKMPLKKQALRKPKKVNKWVNKWSAPCKGRTGQFRFPDDCHAFVDCWRGRGTLKKCFPRNLVFNEATGQCDWPRNVQCVTGDLEDFKSQTRKSREIDLSLPNCHDYTALGYKCTKFWECSDNGEILDSPYDFYGEGVIDARMVPPKKKNKRSKFDPLQKICPGQFEICCKGECKANAKKAKANAKAKRKAVGSNSFCPGDYTGPRPIPGICTKFAECYKGTAIVKNCPPGTHFCINSKLCDWPSKAVCEQLETFTESPELPSSTDSASPRYSSQTASDESQQPTDLAPLYEPGYSFLARSQKIIPAPPSGQMARLRHGKSPSEGYLEIFSFDKWGYVCDSGAWTMEEADVVCKQLGLTRGVRKTTQGLKYGKVDETRKATENVQCTGSEESIEECSIVYEPEGKPCKLSEDIVSISCVPDSWATCKKGEIPFKNSCYTFYPNGTNFNEAQQTCKRDGKFLLEIETQEENDMLSELLFQNSKVTNLMNQVWTGGVGSNIARKNVWFWHSDTDKVMDYRNFWKGWSGGDRLDRATLKYSKAIKLSRTFPFGQSRKKKKNKQQFTDYYFWALEDFSTKLPFICERRQLDIGCTEGDGEDYMGDASRTRYGDECQKWDSPEVGLWFDNEQISKLGPLEGNNKCRNPDGESAPWCLTGNGEYENCDIPSCQKEAITIGPRIDAVTECGSDQFQCTPGECIFSAYVCDGDIDCSNSADEEPNARCIKYEDEFKKATNVKLVDEEVEQWTNRNLEACLRLCVNAKDFTCRAVNHDPKENICVLLENNVGLIGTLEETFNWNYYERIETQVSCSEDSMCESGKCLNSSQYCNGIYDCPDKSDEFGCTKAFDVQVRLVDGKTHSEGRIEIKGYEYDWGGVCDDGFGLPEANVFCREAGFKLGAKEAVLLSRFGTGNQKINLDEVDCAGNEESILECKFNPWTVNDCSLKEFAGVVCIDENRECSDEEWRCKSGECKNLNFLCDTVEDCVDGSDEDLEQCEEEVDIRLVGGNNVTSGRVEVKYHGVWGTVCDDEFGKEEGSVVCKMLGLPGGVKIHKEAAFGEGEGPIWIKTLECYGNESSLVNCPAATWEPNYYCKHMEDVGIECLLTEAAEYDDKSDNDEDGNVVEGTHSGVCGVAEFEFKPSMPIAKVAGGQTASPGSQPWTASIRVKGNSRSFHWCGAIFVAEFYFISAAHCVEDYPKDSYIVRVGDWDQDVEDIDEQEFSIQSVHFHPEFNVGAYLNNDIAVIRIKPGAGGKGVKITSRVKPACLPSSSTSYKPGMECTISGWGSLGQGSGGYSRRLQAATVPILETSKCIQKHVYGPDKLTSGMFCAGFLSGGVDSCQGDSGGPMVCNIRGKNTLLGVISWGYGCGRANKPGVYTRVANYLDWIEEIFNA